MPAPPLPEVIVPALPQDWTWRYYYTAEQSFGRTPNRHIRRRRLEEIGRWLLPEKISSALDVGCGPAEMSALIRRLTNGRGDVVSLDLGLGFVNLARAIQQANGGELKFILADATRIPLRAESFDLVVTMEMIEHVPRWADFVAEAARLLRPDGLLIISTPTRAGLHSWLKRGWQFFTGWEQVNRACLRGEGHDYEKFLAAREVIAAAGRCGFTLEETQVKIFVFSFLPPALLGLNRFVENVLERIPGLRELGVTRFYKFRKR